MGHETIEMKKKKILKKEKSEFHIPEMHLQSIEIDPHQEKSPMACNFVDLNAHGNQFVAREMDWNGLEDRSDR